jgi:hypothetical protein
MEMVLRLLKCAESEAGCNPVSPGTETHAVVCGGGALSSVQHTSAHKRGAIFVPSDFVTITASMPFI